VAIDRTLAAAFIDNNVRHRVLGRRLQSFSLWHRFLLQAIDSPFLRKGEVRFWDMREVVGICRMRYPQCKVRRPWLIPLWCFWWYGWPRVRWRNFLIRTKDRLLEYFGDYVSFPEYSLWYPDPSPAQQNMQPPVRLGPVPDTFVILSGIIAFLGCGEVEAWNTPVCKAYWYQMGYLQHKGEQIDFMDEDERSFQEQMREAEEKGKEALAKDGGA
jgi:hypothetical protein